MPSKPFSFLTSTCVSPSQVADQCKENIFAIETLKDFQYFEENKDQGMNVREKAKALVTLLKVSKGQEAPGESWYVAGHCERFSVLPVNQDVSISYVLQTIP